MKFLVLLLAIIVVLAVQIYGNPIDATDTSKLKAISFGFIYIY